MKYESSVSSKNVGYKIVPKILDAKDVFLTKKHKDAAKRYSKYIERFTEEILSIITNINDGGEEIDENGIVLYWKELDYLPPPLPIPLSITYFI